MKSEEKYNVVHSRVDDMRKDLDISNVHDNHIRTLMRSGEVRVRPSLLGIIAIFFFFIMSRVALSHDGRNVTPRRLVRNERKKGVEIVLR